MTNEDLIDRLLDDNKRCIDIINTEGTSARERHDAFTQLILNKIEIRHLRHPEEEEKNHDSNDAG